MRWVELDYNDLYRGLVEVETRFLVIGRRALILLGSTVQTFDTDLMISPDREDLEKVIAIADDLDLERPPFDLAFSRPVFKLYSDNTHVDIWRARVYRTRDGEDLVFEDMWKRRIHVPQGGLAIPLPFVDDLIRTKRLRREGSPKAQGDEVDIRYLVGLKEREARGEKPEGPNAGTG